MRIKTLKQEYLNKPCFRPVSVKGLACFSYGQDDPLHGRAQHHLPQRTQTGRKRRADRFKRRLDEDSWSGCWWETAPSPWPAQAVGQTAQPILDTCTTLAVLVMMPMTSCPSACTFWFCKTKKDVQNHFRWALLKNKLNYLVSTST